MKPYYDVSDSDIFAADAISIVDPLYKNQVQLWGQDIATSGRAFGAGPRVLKTLDVNRDTLSDADEIELLYKVRAIKKRLPDSVATYLLELKARSFAITNTYDFEETVQQAYLIELTDWAILKALHGMRCHSHDKGPVIAAIHPTPEKAEFRIVNPCCSEFESLISKSIAEFTPRESQADTQ